VAGGARRASIHAMSCRVTVTLALLCAGLLIAPAAPLSAGAANGGVPRFLPWTQGETPRLALTDLAGRRRSLADHRGEVVLVNFWATWCEPCRDEMPSMQKLKQRFAGRRFEVVAVNYGESEAKVSEFVRRMGVDFRVLLDPNQDAPRAWRVRVLPASFLVDAGGRVRFSVVGELDWTSDEAVTRVGALLSE
jgi:thiol-disulfide isomerase/thioredoxin